jgi:hypothetical protein
MQISGVSLTLTWPHRLCLLIVLLGATTIVTSFPLSKHTGGGETAPAFSGLPPSPVEFSSYHHLYKLSHSWLLGVCHCSCLLRPACLFTVLWGIPFPLFSVLRGPRPLCYVSFLLLLIIQFLFFPWGGSQSVQGAMLIWPRVVCGSNAYHLAHLVSCLGAGIWQWHRGPPGFSL